MEEVVATFFNRLEFGELQTFKNMAVLPILGPEGGPQYITLRMALERGVLTVKEVSAGGSIPELLVTNRGDLPVLLLDGEELAGAKQNRALNTTILLPERSKTTIPVSCTEQGRWSYVSREFVDSGYVMAAPARAAMHESVQMALSRGEGFRSNQGEVWEEIATLSERAHAPSPTGAMRDVFQARGAPLKDYLNAFPCQPHQTGLFVFIGGEVAGFDTVSLSSAYSDLHPKLVKSYAMEAMLEPEGKQASASVEQALTFLSEAAGAQGESYDSVGYGRDWRFHAPGVLGSALTHADTVIHAAFFRTAHGASEVRGEGGMARLRHRRRYRE